MNNKKIELAKQTLKNEGYFVDNLWHIQDVMIDYDCNETDANDILYDALKNDATMEQIWLAIEISAQNKGFIKKDDY